MRAIKLEGRDGEVEGEEFAGTGIRGKAWAAVPAGKRARAQWCSDGATDTPTDQPRVVGEPEDGG